MRNPQTLIDTMAEHMKTQLGLDPDTASRAAAIAHALLEGREAQDHHAGEHGPMIEVISACPWCPPFAAGFPEVTPPSPRPGHGPVDTRPLPSSDGGADHG